MFSSPFLPFSLSPFLLFALPLAYSIAVFLKSELPKREISVLAVQPNVSPWLSINDELNAKVLVKTAALTERALKNSEEKPDLIVWHEAAVLFPLSIDENARRAVAARLREWNTPLLTGIFEQKVYAESEPLPPIL